ncbi:hypothetical protein T03_3709 [Trichinella britovi]|uniref:Uncharacterized protein n=1 Tax=Trichinella britovi TaxID=45882 RepID=A0A0V1C3A0_TRIBR|nr:hypothetical protein T03_3709 [Trichinella britovi]
MFQSSCNDYVPHHIRQRPADVSTNVGVNIKLVD